MSDQPLTRSLLAAVLADFHRDVVRPDMQQIVGDEVDRLRSEMGAHFDDVYHRLDRLEDEYQTIKEGLRRLEAKVANVEAHVLDLQAQVLELRTRLGRVEERLEELIALEENYPVRAEVQDLKARIDRLQDDIRRLEERIKP
jgi:predicted  nucleic acid-binding Zn-ribbon protein